MKSDSPYPIEKDPRWKAVIERNGDFDDEFVYAVKTTGVYCRPGSPSRLPKPENVVFFDNAPAAEAQGFRPSKRYLQDQAAITRKHTELIARACQQIEKSETEPALHDLARDAGLSAYHFHRVFKSITGITPKKYAQAHRAQKIRNELKPDTSVTDAIYEAGFSSSSRFYEFSGKMLGMKASEFKKGGADTDIFFAVGECYLGAILVAQSHKGICAISLGDDPDQLVRELQDQFPRSKLVGNDREYEKLIAHVVGFLENPETDLKMPLDIQGTAFQKRVWSALQTIPVGTTASYADIAEKIGSPKAVRAVARACATNSLAIAIPCHRVVRSDGSLSGYRWGVERKRELLANESRIHNKIKSQEPDSEPTTFSSN
ncbi:bifunctional DNA-binding transcriptional regulator/O6-methylguanine-DNA methyltransferase Ada [Endozoicomonas arenosclerae]|uniref:bifunctional DNA-binding transcriptional regulator/O6-methylguanine-DNA methyltransferase Ada n=1 Tax=Endozoicomonas arenosclerae TaxID=1633495 RepID=UPI0009A1FCA6|nr:bifunctional DNA-binding transcriptional regulator/O6-methylguanine-DNA methyltransferase Ada [Endozoicomonas arenosclerae]